MAVSNSTLSPTTRDYKLAARVNLSAVLQRVGKMSDPAFADFFRQNYALLQPALKHLEPAIFKKDTSEAEALKLTRDAIARLSNDVVMNLDYKALGLKKVEAQEFARQRFQREVARALQKEEAKKKARLALRYLNETALMPFKIIGTPFGFAANLLGAALDAFGVSKVARVTALAGLTTANAAMLAAPVDATPYAAKLGSVQQVFKDACTPVILAGMSANAAYTLHFNSTRPHSIERHVHDTMILAAHHGIPAIAVHAIGYFESARFTDSKANNSSASNYFMTIKPTQIRYMRTYGKGLIDYKEATQRIESGTAKRQDKAMVEAIDAIYTLSADTLERMVRAQKYPGYVHDALVMGDVNSIAVQLVAMDMAKKKPELLNPALNAKEIAGIVTDYYTEHHFLGIGNYRLLNTIAASHPTLPLTDQRGIRLHLGEDTQRRLLQVIESNPGLLKSGMNARQALESIQTKFRAYIDKPIQEFAAIHHPEKTSYDYCLTDMARRNNLPHSIPAYKAMGLDLGYDLGGLSASFARYATNFWQQIPRMSLQPETQQPLGPSLRP